MSVPRTEVFDAVVAGAGPAGSATALRLAMHGWRVALVERSRFEQMRVGESLAPEVQPLLRELRVWDDFLALKPLPSWGTRSLWGEAQEHAQSHVFSPYGQGWHIDRCAFDRMLANAAERAGATLFTGTAVVASERSGGGWLVRTQAVTQSPDGDAQPVRRLHARVLLDASGRRAQVARSVGAQVTRFDRLVGVARCMPASTAVQSNHLSIEAVREGWWYSAPLPVGASMIVMLMTDADLCARGHLNRPAAWHALLQETSATRARLAAMDRSSRPEVHCASSQRLHRAAATFGDSWLAVGDAALAVDPISGSGVARALGSTRAAADAAIAIAAEPTACERTIAAYESDRDRECLEFLVTRARYYAWEQRWSASAFWHRRIEAVKALLPPDGEVSEYRASAAGHA